MLFAGGCGGGDGGDTPVVEPPPPPTPRPEPQGSWQDEGNYNTDWYSNMPYEISTAAELAGLAKLVNDGTDTFEDKIIHIMKDIDLGEHYWTPIGFYTPGWNRWFFGTFNGHGFEIRNMTVNITQMDDFTYSGLFGCNNGIIENVYLSNVSVSDDNPGTSGGTYAGGFVAYNMRTIIDCTVSGIVFSSNSNSHNAKAGGFVAYNNGGTITDCTADVTVSAYTTKNVSLAGGFAGENAGKISYCTASGSVSSVSTVHDAYAGGFMGRNKSNGEITRSTAKGSGVTGINGQAGSLYKGSFAGYIRLGGVISDNSPASIPGLYAIGYDERKSPPGPSDDI
jgi:hypothetical protein